MFVCYRSTLIREHVEYSTGCQRFMGILEIARLCQSPAPLPHCFMCSCAGQRPHFELLIRENGKNICKCWICFFSISSMPSGVFLSGELMYLTLPGWSPVSSCSVCTFVVPSFSYRTQLRHSQSTRIHIRSHLKPQTQTRAWAQRGSLDRFFCFSFNRVFSIMQTDANLASDCWKK